MKLKVTSLENKETADIDLADEVFGSVIEALSRTTSLPSFCLAVSAVLRPSWRTFFCRSKP